VVFVDSLSLGVGLWFMSKFSPLQHLLLLSQLLKFPFFFLLSL
jgi:hypothetical protein